MLASSLLLPPTHTPTHTHTQQLLRIGGTSGAEENEANFFYSQETNASDSPLHSLFSGVLPFSSSTLSPIFNFIPGNDPSAFHLENNFHKNTKRFFLKWKQNPKGTSPRARGGVLTLANFPSYCSLLRCISHYAGGSYDVAAGEAAVEGRGVRNPMRGAGLRGG